MARLREPVLGALATSILAVALVCGCSDDDASGVTGDAGNGHVGSGDAGVGDGRVAADSASPQRATISGMVVQFATETDPPLAQVKVTALADSSLSTTTDAAGVFSLQVPTGIGFVLLERDGNLSSLYGAEVPSSGLAGLSLGLLPPEAIDFITAGSDTLPARDATKGHVVVDFDLDARGGTAAGTEGAALSVAHGGSFALDADGGAVDGSSLVAGSDESVLVFLNVAPGTVEVSLDAAGCTAQLPPSQAYPVQAATVTFIQVDCAP